VLRSSRLRESAVSKTGERESTGRLAQAQGSGPGRRPQAGTLGLRLQAESGRRLADESDSAVLLSRESGGGGTAERDDEVCTGRAPGPQVPGARSRTNEAV
jgi:hypothetical protein